jgi:hypothetical protein
MRKSASGAGCIACLLAFGSAREEGEEIARNSGQDTMTSQTGWHGREGEVTDEEHKRLRELRLMRRTRLGRGGHELVAVRVDSCRGLDGGGRRDLEVARCAERGGQPLRELERALAGELARSEREIREGKRRRGWQKGKSRGRVWSVPVAPWVARNIVEGHASAGIDGEYPFD